ncbi:ATP-binding cassette domain-containing protein, partial [Acinetobacter baumannii]
MIPVTSTALLEVSALAKAFGGNRVLQDVSFAVGRGEIVGLLGPNGAGKTTTLRLLLGLTTPASGELTLCGEPVPGRAPQARMRVGV